jgi:hypothetical protein
MPRILIRSGKDPFTVVTPEATLAQDVFCSNVGNYLFSYSTYRALHLPGNELVSNSTLSETRPSDAETAARVNDEFDAFVVPLANAFRRGFVRRLDHLTGLVEQLRIPVTVVGVGAQAGLELDSSDLDDIAPSVRRFVAAVLERSASIGVRGEFTADYLLGLGFPSSAVDIIGCPSLFLRGPGWSLPEAPAPIEDETPVALNLTEGVPGLGDWVMELTRRHPRLVHVNQDKKDLRLMLWGEEHAQETDPGIPLRPDHPLVTEDRIRFPVEAWTWLEYLKDFDFATGTRLHGNVAALLAGVPAVLLAHDSRTLELAEYHDLPFRRVDETLPSLTLDQVREDYAPEAFDKGYADRFSRFLSFLERNDLAHVYGDGGDGGAAFDARVAEVELPAMLPPLTPTHPDQLAARLRWLRDAAPVDSSVHPQAYRHPFPFPTPADQRSPLKRAVAQTREAVKELRRELRAERKRAQRQAAGQKKRAEAQTARLDRQTARLDRQAGRLDALEAQAPSGWRRVGAKVSKTFRGDR